MMRRSNANPLIAPRRGFSFIEVMFAVIVLGIGFIMVSAMFPVAIQQTQMNVEDAATSRVYLTAQSNFTALKQDLIAQTNINVAAYTTSAAGTVFYGWPVTLTSLASPPAVATVFNGKVFSFRDPRWLAWPTNQRYPLPPPTVSGGLILNFAAKYQFPLYSTTGAVTGLWERIRGNLISSAEPQYAYVPMFQRGLSYTPATPIVAAQWIADSKVNIYLFIAAARNRTPYTYTANAGIHSDVFRSPGEANGDTQADTPAGSTLAVLEPRLISVRLHVHGDTADGASDPIVDTIDLTNEATNGQLSAPAAAGTGGFVIISDDNPSPGALNPANAGVVNGVVLQLGAQRSANTGAQFTYELQMAHDFSALSAQQQALFQAGGALRLAYIDAFILSRELRDPNQAYDATNNPYDGPVQDLTVQQFTLPIQ